MAKFGEAGKQYINWCANFAMSLNIGVPWIMCQQWNTPSSMVINFPPFSFFPFFNFNLLL